MIEGHTDNDGDETYNMELSEKRCISVKNRLIDIYGENSLYELETKPYGESKPRVPNDSDENKQQNRRVEITVIPPKDYYQRLLKKSE